MLIYLFFLIHFIITSSFSISIEKKCLNNTDCDSNLICNQQTNTCTCEESFFWHDEYQSCSTCPLNWIEFQRKKCLLYPHSIQLSYKIKKICKSLTSQPMRINNIQEFKFLQNQIKNEYFHQGIWIDINNKWIESYTWCNNNKRDFFDCLQIRYDNRTNKICLEYVSCFKQSYFICQAEPIIQSKKKDKILFQFIRQKRVAPIIKTTTKKPSKFDVNNLVNVAGGVAGSIASIFGSAASIWGKPAATHPPAVVDNPNNHNINYEIEVPQALAANESNEGGFMKMALWGGGIIAVVIIIIIIISIIACSNKKKSSNSQSSVHSTESYMSTDDDE